MVGDRVVAAMRRVNPADFRANIGSGGHGQAYVPTQEEALAGGTPQGGDPGGGVQAKVNLSLRVNWVM